MKTKKELKLLNGVKPTEYRRKFICYNKAVKNKRGVKRWIYCKEALTNIFLDTFYRR